MLGFATRPRNLMTKSFVLLVGLLASACGAAHDGPEGPTLDGAWLLRGTTASQSCADYSIQFPFSPQPVEIESDGGGITLSSPLAGRFTYAGSRGVFAREVTLADDVILTSTWQIAAVSQTRLSAALTFELDGRGQTCMVQFAVAGVRP
jgi:hypothetical protein